MGGMPLAGAGGQYGPGCMQCSRRNRIAVGSELPARRVHHPFRQSQPLPHPHDPVRAPGPHFVSRHLDAEPLLRLRVPAPQPRQPLARASDIPHPDAIASPLRDAEVPPARTPDHLRDPTASPNLIIILGVGTDGENARVPAPPEPIVQPHPPRIRPRGQHALATHAQRGHDPLHALPLPLSVSVSVPRAPRPPAPPARRRAHPRHGSVPVSLQIDDADAALAPGEEGVDVLGVDEERVRTRPGFRRRADERVRRHDPVRGEWGEEPDRQGARGGEGEAGGGFSEVV